MIRYSISFFLTIFFSNFCYAGVEHELLVEKQNECTIRITHEATPDSETGSIIFKSYKIEDNIHSPCETSEASVSIFLNKAFQQYSSHSDLKPITSIMIGRLIRYSWAKDLLKQSPIPKISSQEFNKEILFSPIIKPFQKAIKEFNYRVTDVSCEKTLYSEKGFAIDALCWLVVRK
jgi:hypothetical protein